MVGAFSFTKSYSSKNACSGVTLKAERGKIVVLLGPNGAGKSTLLKAFAAQHYATSGKIIAERGDGALFDAALNPKEVKALAGFISDAPALYDDWTVWEFLCMAADLRLGSKSAAASADAAKKCASICNLDSVLNQKISSLSHGYKQRVNFAQALVHDPQILILDEPATGLDPEQIREMRKLVLDLKKDRSIIFSTHIIQEAEALADIIYIVNKGVVAASGSAQELLKASGAKTLEDAYMFFVGAAKDDSTKDDCAQTSAGASKDGCAPKAAVESAGMAAAASILRLAKKEVHAYAINPFYWIFGLLFALFCPAAFFAGTRFFVQGEGSASFAPFFLAMSWLLSCVFPAFLMNIKSRAFDQGLPFAEGEKFLARLLASLFLFVLYALPTLFTPLCVSLFGSVDWGAVATAYLGLFFFAAASLSFCLFLSSFFTNRAAYFAVSVLSLAAINSVHRILTYVQFPDFVSSAIRQASFAWRFDSASKGIFDTRDFSCFAIWTFAFVLLAASSEEVKKGKKYFSKANALKTWTMIFIVVFLSLDTGRLYKRVDFSAGKIYTPSQRTKELLAGAQEKVRVTYYRSSELLKLYPQIRDVGDFLRSISGSCPNFTYAEFDADKAEAAKILSELSAQAFQIQKQKGNSLEYVNAYSAVVIDYMDKTLFLPAAFSTFSLEYDLNLRLDYLISGKSRKAYVLAANGMKLAKDYKSALDWLNIEGFETVELNESDGAIERLDAAIPLLLFGTKNLGPEAADALEAFMQKGGAVFAMTSPYTVDVDGNWSLAKNKRDYILPVFERRGIAFLDSLAADISCVRAAFRTADSGSQESQNKYINYPLWISALPQEAAPYGASFFWASPLSVDETKAKALLLASPASWRFLPDKKNPDLLFDTNPFTVPKSAIADPFVQKEQSVLAAKTLDNKLLVFSGDLFANDLLLSLSGGETGDFRNLNCVTTSLLELAGDYEMASLKNKGGADFSLWKITQESEWNDAKNFSILVNFVLVPIFILAFAIVYLSLRRGGKRK